MQRIALSLLLKLFIRTIDKELRCLGRNMYALVKNIELCSNAGKKMQLEVEGITPTHNPPPPGSPL